VVLSADGQIESVKYQLLEALLLSELQRQEAENPRSQGTSRPIGSRLIKCQSTMKLGAGV
jgi:hypothetical protein